MTLSQRKKHTAVATRNAHRSQPTAQSHCKKDRCDILALVKIGKHKFDCELADTPQKRSSGLMLRGEIKPMLFVFDHEKRWAFHTFFMLKSIDMVFINSKKEVVDVKTARPWLPVIKPSGPVKYVLELPLGFGKCFGVGKKVEF